MLFGKHHGNTSSNAGSVPQFADARNEHVVIVCNQVDAKCQTVSCRGGLVGAKLQDERIGGGIESESELQVHFFVPQLHRHGACEAPGSKRSPAVQAKRIGNVIDQNRQRQLSRQAVVSTCEGQRGSARVGPGQDKGGFCPLEPMDPTALDGGRSGLVKQNGNATSTKAGDKACQ
jgi:hypothetical protein